MAPVSSTLVVQTSYLGDTVLTTPLLAQLSIAMVHKRCWRAGLVGKLVTMAWAVPATLAGLTVARLLPCSRDLFLDNVVVATKDPAP